MEISSTQYLHGAQTLQGPHQSVGAKETAQTTTRENAVRDEVRFSEEGLRLSETRSGEESSVSGVRFELVNRIKAEIAAGTYDTPDKMDIALDRLIERLNPR